MSVYDLNDLQAKYDILVNELQVCRCKLDSKCEALLILSKELDGCRSERDQFKLMAEQLRERYQAIKRQVTGRSPRGSSYDLLDVNMYRDMETESLVHLLCDTKEIKKCLIFEVDDLKQKLHDAQGDIKLLREQIARQRVGTSDEGMTTRHFPAYEREDLVKQLEASREQYNQLEQDLQQLLDEKEDQETERDGYKNKYENLNRELNYILKGDEKRIVDIDALVAENKYLTERLTQMEEEKTMAMATASKYKSILERRKNKGILKFGQSRSGGLVITQKQVGQMLNNQAMPSTPQAMADLQGLCGALLDTINDKNLALSHQRKTNKILGNRVSELEKKLKTLEVSGLWNVPDMTSLEKLRSECDEVKTLIPRHISESSDTSIKTNDKLEDLDDLDSELSSSTPSSVTSPLHVQHTVRFSSHSVDMDDLDLLPTKESLPTSKYSDMSEPTKDVYSLPCQHDSSDKQDDSDSHLDGFVIEKSAQKHKPVHYSTNDKYANCESKSLLDTASHSESDSSPEKQKYSDVSDYDEETDNKIAILLTDATSRLRDRSHNTQESDNPISVNSSSKLIQKTVSRSSLVMKIDCDFNKVHESDMNVNNDEPAGDTVNRSQDNLIDMNSPEHDNKGELTVDVNDSAAQISQPQQIAQSQPDIVTSTRDGHHMLESPKDTPVSIPVIHISDEAESCEGTDVKTSENNETDSKTIDSEIVPDFHHSNKFVNSDVNVAEVEIKDDNDVFDVCEDDDEDDHDDDDTGTVTTESEESPSKQPLLFDNEESNHVQYQPSQSSSSLC